MSPCWLWTLPRWRLHVQPQQLGQSGEGRRNTNLCRGRRNGQASVWSVMG